MLFGCEACGILVPNQGMKGTQVERELGSPPALEGQVLTTGPPGKSQKGVLSNYFEKVVSHELF